MTIPTPRQLIEAGAHIGRKKSKWNPKMAPFVFGVRNNIHIFDVYQTIMALEKAIEFLQGIKRSGGKILFVGVKVQSRNIVRDTAKSLTMPYVIDRWIGGLLTNFKVIRERIKFFDELEKKQTNDETKKYTKKERLHFDRQLKKLSEELGGIRNMERLPQAIVISNIEREMAAVREAKKVGIPVVAIADTDADPTLVDWPIPANDSAISSLNLLYNTIKDELAKVSPDPQKTEESKVSEEEKVKDKKLNTSPPGDHSVNLHKAQPTKSEGE